jgi:ClpP class serine protease
MSIGDLFWLCFIFSAIRPMLRQRLLEAMRIRKISQIEGGRKSRVILLVHRQETMRLLGFPIARYIDINDSEDVLRAVQMTDVDVPIDVVLYWRRCKSRKRSVNTRARSLCPTMPWPAVR